MHNIHMLYKVSSGHFQISERHKAKGIHRNIIQRSNAGMPAMTNVHLSVDKSIYKSSRYNVIITVGHISVEIKFINIVLLKRLITVKQNQIVLNFSTLDRFKV